MRIISEVNQSIVKTMSPCALAIGNFDGLHLGHQSVINNLKRLAKKNHLKTAVMIFNPHPKIYFSNQKEFKTIFDLDELISSFSKTNIDTLICMPFTKETAAMSADDFVNQLLIKDLTVKAIVVGEDFKFGKNRQGDVSYLKKLAEKQGVIVDACVPYLLNSNRVSSTLIKELLAKAKLDEANRLLSRPYTVQGTVVHGDKRGTDWGFPTANLQLSKQILLPYGIYVVNVIMEQKEYQAVASYGVRPTVVQRGEAKLEVHLLDEQISCYDEFMSVQFLHYLRPEEHFSNVEELIVQMQDDCNSARNYFEQVHKA